MKVAVTGAVFSAFLSFSVPLQAQPLYVEGPQPVATYTVCNHQALFAVNPRAIPVSAGGRVITNNGSIVTITRSPDIFIQTKKLVRNSYQSLSSDGSCY